jgi:2-haloacid dehalogenase
MTIALFDLNGTLTDPSAVGELWGAPDLGPAALQLAVQSAMTETILGEYHEFREHLRGALCQLGAQDVEAALERASRLPAQPDAEEALERLASAGLRLAVLTNSGADSGRQTLEAAGLAGRFEQILGVDAVRRFKPHPAAYEHALTELGASAGEVVLVAAHAWDVWGAARAGLATAWVGSGAFPQVAPAPDIAGNDLAGAAAQIVERFAN